MLAELFPSAKRGIGQARSGGDSADVEGLPFWVEVKRTEREAPRAALRQAIADTDGRPPVVFTRPNRGPWMVCMLAEDWMTLVDEASAAPAVTFTNPLEHLKPVAIVVDEPHPADINPERPQDCGNQRCDD